MSTHPYIPLYVDDYEAATAHLSVEEDGVYSRLIRLCWRTPGCSLPSDPGWIARKIRLSAEDFDRIAKPVLAEFFKLQRGRLVQLRLKREYDAISRKKSARKAAGRKGGEAKSRNEHDKLASNASGLLEDMRASPEPEPEPEPDRLRIASPSGREAVDWSERLREATESAGPGLDRTSPATHAYSDLRQLCEPQVGEPCQWDEVLDAVRIEAAKAATKGRPLRSWSWIKETAVAMRDRRLQGLPPAAVTQPRSTGPPLSYSQQADIASVEARRRILESDG